MSATRKGGAMTMVIGIIAILVIGGGIWYFVSDPFHTKVDAAVKDWTKWTPENIAKDPVNYLNFCEDQATKAKEKLKASKIRVHQSIGTLEGMQKENKAKAEAGGKALDELREVYNQSAAVTWPVTWRNTSYSEPEFKSQAKRLDRETRSAEQLLKTVESGLAQLKNQLVKIDEAQSQAEEQLATIASKREMLKVQAITQDLTKQLVDMKAALQATVVTTDEADSKIKSLTELTSAQATSVSDSEFDALMKKK